MGFTSFITFFLTIYFIFLTALDFFFLLVQNLSGSHLTHATIRTRKARQRRLTLTGVCEVAESALQLALCKVAKSLLRLALCRVAKSLLRLVLCRVAKSMLQLALCAVAKSVLRLALCGVVKSVLRLALCGVAEFAR